MSKRTTKRIKFGVKITQQNLGKSQNTKQLFPGRAPPKTLHRIYLIISTASRDPNRSDGLNTAGSVGV